MNQGPCVPLTVLGWLPSFVNERIRQDKGKFGVVDVRLVVDPGRGEGGGGVCCSGGVFTIAIYRIREFGFGV